MVKIPSAIPAPTIGSAMQAQFVAGQNLTFVNPITAVQIAWWHGRFGARGPSPGAIAHALGRKVALPISYELDIRDDHRDEVRIGLVSLDQAGKVLEAERSILFLRDALNLSFMEVRMDFRGRGVGFQLVANCYDLAESLSLKRLTVTAVDDGSYLWAKAGFVPFRRVWNETSLKDTIARKLHLIPGVSWAMRDEVYTALGSDDPHSIYILVGMRDPVPSTAVAGTRVPLGRALLAESGATWAGSLEFNDRLANLRARSQLPITSR
jgi:GNAT superfamily N-acetyltransferase